MKPTLTFIIAIAATVSLSGCMGIAAGITAGIQQHQDNSRVEQASPYYPYTSFMNRTMFLPRTDVAQDQTNQDIRECVRYVQEVDGGKDADYARGMNTVARLSGGLANRLESDRATEKLNTMRSDVLRNCLQAKGYKTLF